LYVFINGKARAWNRGEKQTQKRSNEL
jgi:hypothetical protein